MDENTKPAARFTRAAIANLRLAYARAANSRVAAYLRAVRDPGLSRRARTGAAFKAMASLALMGVGLLVAYTILLIPFTPSISDLRKAKIEQPSVLMSADGKRLAVFKRLNREWVELKQVSPYVIDALIATEDHRFYEHHGIDFRRVASSLLHTLRGDVEGGSTLTQQLARNLYPEEIGRKRSITRKLKELITALKIEYAYSKSEILVTYLNTMPFLYNAYGIEMGARTYFDKPASKLTVLESATLIGMLKGTSYYNPVLNPDRAVKRRNVVMSQMVKRGVLTQANFDNLKKRPLRLDFARQPEPLGPAPHFAEYVRKWLVDWADRYDYNIYSDGLVIYTTIDSRMQMLANQIVERQTNALQAVADVEWGLNSERLISTSTPAYTGLRRRVQPFGYFWNTRSGVVDAFIRESVAYHSMVESGIAPDAALAQLRANADFMARLRADKTRLQAGFVAIDPANGQVRAWVGSRDFATDQFDHVAQARRQPGSTFKPFVYGAALEDGMRPDRRFADIAVEIPLGNGSVWKPSDVNGPSGRQMTVREGLVYSKNSITAQVMQEVGPRKVVSFARKAGIASPLDPVPALALGTSPVTPLEMVTAYSTIAARGEYHKPVMIHRIADKDGNVLATFTGHAERAIPTENADDLIDMMRGVVNQGTGAAIRSRYGVQADVAGKTGTTQNNTDGWFILMHPRLVAGSWIGFNDARVTMRSDYWGQGANTALPVVGDFFRQALNTRLIDAKDRFPKSNESFMDAVLEKFNDWFSLFQEKVAPPPAQGHAPRPSVHSQPQQPQQPQQPLVREHEPERDVSSDELERIIRQASEADHAIIREQRRSEAPPAVPPASVGEPRKESTDGVTADGMADH